jgi:hypothetical protein
MNVQSIIPSNDLINECVAGKPNQPTASAWRPFISNTLKEAVQIFAEPGTPRHRSRPTRRNGRIMLLTLSGDPFVCKSIRRE